MNGAIRNERVETAQMAGQFLVFPSSHDIRCLCGSAYGAHPGGGRCLVDPCPCKRFTPRLGDRIRAAFALIWWAR